MAEPIHLLNDEQLKSLIALLVDSATPLTMESIHRNIDTIGAELLRRQHSDEAVNA